MVNSMIRFDRLTPSTNYNICASCQGVNKICKQIQTSKMVKTLVSNRKIEK
jgi:hypothetical protein